MENSWKDFFKENAFLFLAFFVVVFGFLGLTIYNGVKEARLNNIKYEKSLPEETPLVIRSYEANEYKVVTKTDQDLAEYYLRQLTKMWDEDPGKLYDLMDSKAKYEYTSRDDCINKLRKLKSTNTRNSKVAYYKVDSGSVVIVTDLNIEFKLSVKGINDYTIVFMGQV